jgi:diguanylate cyclase
MTMMSDQHPPFSTAFPPPMTLSGELHGLFRRYGTPRPVRFAETLFERGACGQSMYLVEDGQVELIFKGSKEPKRLDPGAVFGELAFVLSEHPRSATAIAISAGHLWELDQAGFQRLYREAPQVLCELMRHTCRYLFLSEQQLIEGLEAQRQELELAMDFLRRTREELGLSIAGKEMLDAETGLYNGRCLQQQLHQAAAAGMLHRHALLRLNLAGVEEVEGLLGREYREMVVNHFAATLRRLAGEQDLPCHLGGTAFALLIPRVSEADARHLAAEIYAETARRSLAIPNLELAVSVTIGGVMGGEGKDAEGLLRQAEAAHANAQAQGAPALWWALCCESDALEG